MTLSQMLCEHGQLSGCFDCMVGGAPSAHHGTTSLDAPKTSTLRPKYVQATPATGYGWSDTHSARIQQTRVVRSSDMSEKQRVYLSDLIRMRGTQAHRDLDLDDVDRTACSRLIDELLKLPMSAPAPVANPRPIASAPSPLPNVADGRYAIDIDGTTKFYHVGHGRDGRLYLDVYASDNRFPIHNYATKLAVLTEIARDARGAMTRYGQLIGSCGICGRALTDEESRAIGIGPICNGRIA